MNTITRGELTLSAAASATDPPSAGDFLRSAASAADRGCVELSRGLAALAVDMLTMRASAFKW